MSFLDWQRQNLPALKSAGFVENTMQEDWVGGLPERKFKDIRNTRDTVAEEKARLCLLLTQRCNRVPDKLKSGGSIGDVRAWKATREAALKVCANKRASVGELEAALNSMAAWS